MLLLRVILAPPRLRTLEAQSPQGLACTQVLKTHLKPLVPEAPKVLINYIGFSHSITSSCLAPHPLTMVHGIGFVWVLHLFPMLWFGSWQCSKVFYLWNTATDNTHTLCYSLPAVIFSSYEHLHSCLHTPCRCTSWRLSPGLPSSSQNNFGLHFLLWWGQHQHFPSYFFYHPCWGSMSAWSSPLLASEGPWPFFAVSRFKYPTCMEGNQSGGLLDGIILCCYVYIRVWVVSSNHHRSCPFQAQATSLKDSQW